MSLSWLARFSQFGYKFATVHTSSLGSLSSRNLSFSTRYHSKFTQFPQYPHDNLPQCHRHHHRNSHHNNSSSKNDKNHWPKYVLLAGVAESIFLSSTTPVQDDEHRAELRSTMILNIKRAILAMRESDYRKADDLLHISLGIAQQIKDPQGEVYILDLLANLYFEEKKYDQAEATFKEVLRRELSSSAAEKQDTASIIEISAKLAKIYADTQQVEKAQAGYKFCVEQFEKLFSDLSAEKKEEVVDLYLKIIQWGSEFILNLENKTEDTLYEASDFIEKGLKKAQEFQETGSEAYQTLTNNLSTLYVWQNRMEDAISVMKETIKLAVASQHWSLGHFYLNLAHIYAENSDWTNAAAMNEKAGEFGRKNADRELVEEVEKLRADLKKRTG